MVRTRYRRCSRCGGAADYCVLYIPTDATGREPYKAQRCAVCLADYANEPVAIEARHITQVYESAENPLVDRGGPRGILSP